MPKNIIFFYKGLLSRLCGVQIWTQSTLGQTGAYLDRRKQPGRQTAVKLHKVDKISFLCL